MKIVENIAGVPAPVGAYSPAVQTGNLIFCSGQIGLNPETGELVSGLTGQIKQVLDNLENLLKGSGSSKDKIVMSSIFLADISDAKLVNEVYSEFFSKNSPESRQILPARQTLAVKDLPLGALVEISIVAEV